MICFHGYGANYKIAQTIKDWEVTDATLLSFNFPDHDIQEDYDPNKATFGKLDELLPALYVLKQVVINQGLVSIDLYGFSSGGGAVINLIAILNDSAYESRLNEIGIGNAEKSLILAAIQNGIVILDCPLKSVEEIIDFRGSTKELEILANNYCKNGLRPIDSVSSLKGLSLDIILYFEEKDEVLSNRDDALYIKRLEEANSQGTTSVVTGNEGGHSQLHRALWKCYSQKLEAPKEEDLNG